MYARFLTLTHRMHREDSDSCAAALREVRHLNGQQRRTRIALIRVHRRLWGDELHVVGRTAVLTHHRTATTSTRCATTLRRRWQPVR